MEFSNLFDEQPLSPISNKKEDNKNNDNHVVKNRRTREMELETELAQTKTIVVNIENKYKSLETKLHELLYQVNERHLEKEKELEKGRKLEAELSRTKKQLQALENKYTNLELAIDTMVEREKQQNNNKPFTIIPYFGNGAGQSYYSFYSTGCEEILISNNTIDHGMNGRQILPAVLYFDNILFGEIDKIMNNNVNYEIQCREKTGVKKGPQPVQIKGQNAVEFLKQFTNVKRLIIHIGYDLTNKCEYGGPNRQMENLIYTIVTIMSFTKDYDIIIRGRYAREFQKILLKEFLKHKNYKRLLFEIDNTQMNGTYSNDWNNFLVNGIQGLNPIKELQTHCVNNNIIFEHNIVDK
jgi:hypothetical protein